MGGGAIFSLGGNCFISPIFIDIQVYLGVVYSYTCPPPPFCEGPIGPLPPAPPALKQTKKLAPVVFCVALYVLFVFSRLFRLSWCFVENFTSLDSPCHRPTPPVALFILRPTATGAPSQERKFVLFPRCKDELFSTLLAFGTFRKCLRCPDLISVSVLCDWIKRRI